MEFNLLIVEAPAKVKTIAKYLKGLDGDWQIVATKGHIVNLPKNRDGLNEENGHIRGEWLIDEDKEDIVKKISSLAMKAKRVYIATDADREGERIAFDVIEKAKVKTYYRVTYREITQKAIQEALTSQATLVDENVVRAQVARRLIDRKIGYPVSRMLQWDFKTRGLKDDVKGLAVGRVISAALRLICERQQQIDSFISEIYYQIGVSYSHNGIAFTLYHPSRFSEDHVVELQQMIAYFQKHEHIIKIYTPNIRSRNPYTSLDTTEFLTSCAFTYQIATDYAMKLAGDLYIAGLINYHRTDSKHLSQTAMDEIIALLHEIYDDHYVMTTARQFRNKENAQGGHEALRPTYFEKEYGPKSVVNTSQWIDHRLTHEHHKIYNLIWRRTMATQMESSKYDSSEIVISVGDNELVGRANDRIFDGWERMLEKQGMMGHRDIDTWKDRRIVIPDIEPETVLHPLEIKAVERTTQAPDRFGVGTFVKTLEQKGIARPSTIGEIITNLTQKGYIKVTKMMIEPTPLGKMVDNWTTANAPWLSNYNEAAIFELRLDAIEQGEDSDYEAFFHEYADRVEHLAISLGYSEPSMQPATNEQRRLATVIAQKNSINLPDDVFSSKTKTSMFIAAHKEDYAPCGQCPSCKNMTLFERDKMWKCSEKACSFILWRSDVERFFHTFQKEVDTQSLSEIKYVIFKIKKYHLTDLRSPKTNELFDASIKFSYNTTYKKWGIEIVKERKDKKGRA